MTPQLSAQGMRFGGAMEEAWCLKRPETISASL
jgi:hypothetical protein